MVEAVQTIVAEHSSDYFDIHVAGTLVVIKETNVAMQNGDLASDLQTFDEADTPAETEQQPTVPVGTDWLRKSDTAVFRIPISVWRWPTVI